MPKKILGFGAKPQLSNTNPMYRTTSNLKILVIEANDDHWTFIKKVTQESLREMDVSRTVSVVATEAFLKECSFEEWNMPDLIVQDPYLPSFDDGLMFVKHLKSMSTSHKLVPIVMLSSSDAHIDVKEAYEAGISSYCLKPTSLEGWASLFENLYIYWSEIATLPPKHYSLF